MLLLQFILMGQSHFSHSPQKCTNLWQAAPLRSSAAYNKNRGIDLQIEGMFFRVVAIAFTAERHMQTDKILMDRTHEAIIPALQYMAATPMEKVYRVTFQCSVSMSSFFSISSARQAALATIRAEGLRHGREKCTVLEC